MPIYWTLKSIPELASLPRAARGRAWRRASAKTLRHWQTWVGLLACAGCAALGRDIGGEIGYATIGGLVGAGTGGFIVSQVTIGVARRYYAHLLTLN